MKRSILFMACCIGLMLLASCKKDPIAPTIKVFNGAGYAVENTQVFSGDQITVGFVAMGENLTQIEVTLSQNGTTLTQHSENIEKLDLYNYSHTFSVDAIGTVTIIGKITDAAGQTAVCSFNILCEEKPNAKFVGHYEGDALFTGIMKAEFIGMDSMEQEVTDRPVPVTLDLRAGEGLNDVVGTCKTEDQEMEIKGIVDGNSVTFEAVNTTFTFNYTMNGFNVSPTMDVTYNVKGTLNGETLSLDGTCVGNGNLNLIIYNGTIAMDGTLGGSLNKMQ